ncbi:MAG: F0F1 ATP synthase subunit delta [Rhodospirillaceae bacterium TMED8]|nr:F0F1 ATP synthase subunit delta [Magnetovibrio sp.]OUT48589.1 MAG: F0F1 ATP synthase subunit delta [Rhodospirillaceae bacterium TMED8]
MPSDVTGVTGLSGRYARALFELADEQKQIDSIVNDMNIITSMLDESDDLTRLIKSPVIGRIDQQNAMQALLNETGISELTKNFLGVVIQNRRLFSLPSIIIDYLSLVALARGESTAEVVSAKPLTESQQQAISKALKQAVGSKVSIKSVVDETLLGGLIVKVGSRMVDTSLKTKLAQLHLTMKGVG